MKIVGANGIATNGEGSIDLLLRRLSLLGFETNDVRLPVRHWFSARWAGNDDGLLIAKESGDGDIIVAHSFGCLRAFYAHEVRDYRAIVCIAPAMSPNTVWRHPERVHCWHSAGDWAVRVGSWLRFHPFGAAGNRGFEQKGVVHTKLEGVGHSDYFRGNRLDRLVKYVADLAR